MEEGGGGGEGWEGGGGGEGWEEGRGRGNGRNPARHRKPQGAENVRMNKERIEQRVYSEG